MISRSGWLVLGAVAIAWIAGSLGPRPAAAVLGVGGLFTLIAMVRGACGARGAERPLILALVGAGAVLLRLVVLPSGPPAVAAVPAGDGPWTFVVEATGAPRDGHQVATLRFATGPGSPAGRVAATLPAFPEVIAGDRVIAETSIRPRPSSAYGDYLERIGAVGTVAPRSIVVERPPPGPATLVESARQAAASALAEALPEPEAGLADGILIGLRDRVDRDVAAAFTTAGVSHVVAISGWNIAIVGAAVAAAFGRMRRRRRSVLTMAAILAYVAFAGASASVVRAGAMAAVVLLARESGRAGRAAAALAWAVTILILADPGLVNDAGFQLSALATAGLIAWATPLTARIERLGRGRIPSWLAENLGVSLAAQAATLPVILVSFGRLAVLSPLVNLVVVPLIAPAMAAGLLAMAAGALTQLGIPPLVGAVLATPGWVTLRILVTVVEAASRVPFASVTLPPASAALAAAASVVAVLAAHRWSRRRSTGQSRHAAGRSPDPRPAPGPTTARPRAMTSALAALTAAIVVAGAVVVSRSAGVARITVLDVGQGDAILVEGSRGGRLLIDGGPDPSRLMVVLDSRIPAWDRRLDAVILSHPHEDHVAGLARLLARYRVGRVFEPGMVGPGPGYAEWLRRLAAPGGPVRLGLAAGDSLAVDEVDLRVLWPIRGRVSRHPPDGGTGINNVSVVLLGAVGRYRFLLAGDVEEAIDPSLLADGLPRLDLLKVAHHGSRTATTQPFVDAVRPKIAIASAGTGNPYGHPARATLERLAAAGARVFRTDVDGTVAVTFTPDGMSVDASGGRPAAVAVPTPRQAVASAPIFRCAIPVAALVPEREPPPAPVAPLAVRQGGSPSVGYHRDDDGPGAGGRRLPPALPRTSRLAPAALARRGRGRRVPGGADGRPRDRDRPPAGGGCRTAPRRRQGAAGRRSGSRAPPWRRVGSLADPSRSS